MRHQVKTIIKYCFLIGFIILSIVLLIEAAIPGDLSAKQSNNISNKVSGFLDSVTEETVVDIDPESVSIKCNKTDVVINEKIKLLTEYTPSNTTNRAINWISSDEQIAIINTQGEVSFLSEGEVTISVVVPNTTITSSLTFTVTEVIPEEILITTTTTSLAIDETLKLRVKFTPSNSSNKTITWESADDTIASVNNGQVIAHSLGTTTIRATSSNGLMSTIVIDVNEKHVDNILPESIDVTTNNTSIPTQMHVDDELPIIVSFTPSNVTNTSYIYHIDNPELLTIENHKLIAKKSGTTSITFISVSNSELKKIMTIEILESLPHNLHIQEVPDIIVGERYPLIILYDNTPSYKYFTFSSSNNDVATVDQNGIVMTKQSGTVTITIVCSDHIQDKIESSITISVKRQSFIKDLSSFRLLIRKGIGHFGAFFILSLLTMFSAIFFIKKKTLGFILTLVWGIIIASTTEIIQLYTEGRCGCLSDVLLDLSGYIIPFIIGILIYIFYILLHKKENNYES